MAHNESPSVQFFQEPAGHCFNTSRDGVWTHPVCVAWPDLLGCCGFCSVGLVLMILNHPLVISGYFIISNYFLMRAVLIVFLLIFYSISGLL